MSFEQSLSFGKVAESAISKWLQARGNYVLPVYEIEKSEYAGPALFINEKPCVAPDMLCIKPDSEICFIESKNKEAFTWHRKTQRWTTGIDLKHYEDYIFLSQKTKIPIYLFFNHRGGAAKDSDKSESGLFFNDLAFLKDNENHRCKPKDHCNSGMVFWSKENLKRIGDALC